MDEIESEITFEGWFELDEAGYIVVDSDGTVAFGPWSCLDPEHWEWLDRVQLADESEVAGDDLDEADAPIYRKLEACLYNLDIVAALEAQPMVRGDLETTLGTPLPGTFEILDERPAGSSDDVPDPEPAGDGFENGTIVDAGLELEPPVPPRLVTRFPSAADELVEWLTDGIPEDALDPNASRTERLEATLYLDADGELTRDDAGDVRVDLAIVAQLPDGEERVALECLPPKAWGARGNAELPQSWVDRPTLDPEVESAVSRLGLPRTPGPGERTQGQVRSGRTRRHRCRVPRRREHPVRRSSGRETPHGV